MTLKPQCDCSTCDACGNAPGRSGYCLNCEVTDSGAEGSHAQPETPGPITLDYEPTGFGSGKLLLDGEHGPELIGTMNGQGRYNYGQELVIRHNAYPAMLEALKAVESEITRLERISKQAFSIDEVHPAVGRVADATRAALHAAERPGDTR